MRAIFRAYGLCLGANQAIPGLTPDPEASRVDVQIHLDSLPAGISESFPSAISPCTSLHAQDYGWPAVVSWHGSGGNGFRLLYDDGTLFIIDARGSRIWAHWPKSMTLEDTAVYLLGPVLAFVLCLRGVTSLHASAFTVDGRAVALVGPSGAGKSTTAAAFAGRGFSVLSDDMLALEEQDQAIVVHPGYPRLRLWPDSVHILDGAPATLPRLTPNWDKCYLSLQGNSCKFDRQSRPLSAIYLLDLRRDQPAAPFVESLSASAALLGLVANARGDFHPDRQSRRREFDMLGRVARQIPVGRVAANTRPDSLQALCDVIFADLQTNTELGVSERRLACTI